MTHTKTTGSVGSGTSPHSADRKAVLVCPRCRYESPVDGDWVRVVNSVDVDIHCPDCRAYLTTRPR